MIIAKMSSFVSWLASQDLVYGLPNILLGLLVIWLIHMSYGMLLFIINVFRTRALGKRLDHLPGEPKHFFYGNLKEITNRVRNHKFLEYLIAKVKKFPRIYRVWLGPTVTNVYLTHPETAKILLKSEQPKYVDKTAIYKMLIPWLGEGLLISNGRKWFRNRRLLTQAFHFDNLKGYVGIMNDSADKLISKIQEQNVEGEMTEICPLMGFCALDSILKCAFSYEEDVQTQGHPIWRIAPFLYYLTSNGRSYSRNCAYVHKFADDIIAQRKKQLADERSEVTKKKRHLDFLDILLAARDENGIGLTDLEIRNEVDTFLFAGHDTTASGMSWTLYCLAKNPGAQKLASDEIDAVLNGKPDVDWQDLSQFTYLVLCIKEAMRLYPPVPGFGRQLNTDMEIDGNILPAGTHITVSVYSMNHNPQIWGEDHQIYNPDRFKHDNMKNKDPYSFVPFSAGSRNCIGQNFAMNEMKITLAKILSRFWLTTDCSDDPGPYPELVMRAKYGIKIKFTCKDLNKDVS